MRHAFALRRRPLPRRADRRRAADAPSPEPKPSLTAKEFFKGDSGKAVIGLFLTAILIVWPASAGWFAASLTLSYTVAKLRNAFQRLDAEEAASKLRESDVPPLDINDLLAVGHAGSLPAPR